MQIMIGFSKNGVPTAACIVAVLVFSGCATLNEEECQKADWVEIGYHDGARGYPDQLRHHIKACSKHGVTADADRYRRGHLQGLTEFCVPETGYQLGIEQKEYAGQCPAAQQAAFVAEYVYGLRLALDSLEIAQDEVDGDLNRERMAGLANDDERDAARIDDRIDYLQSRRDELLDKRREINSWILKWGG